MKRIIVEGIDGSGKTTLVNKLAEKFPSLFPVSGFKKSGYSDYQAWLVEQFKGFPGIPVHDRFVYSELIYGSILRGNVELRGELLHNVLGVLRETSLLIYCRPSYPKVMESFTVEPQMEGVAERLTQLYDEYDRIMVGEQIFYGNRFFRWTFELPQPTLMDKVRHYIES